MASDFYKTFLDILRSSASASSRTLPTEEQTLLFCTELVRSGELHAPAAVLKRISALHAQAVDEYQQLESEYEQLESEHQPWLDSHTFEEYPQECLRRQRELTEKRVAQADKSELLTTLLKTENSILKSTITFMEDPDAITTKKLTQWTGDLYQYSKLSNAASSLHPITPLVKAWLDTPPFVNPEKRSRRILPKELRDSKCAQQGELFPIGRIHENNLLQQLLPLPAFNSPSVIVPVLPLDFYEYTGGKTESPGRGAPLGLRLWIYTIAALPLARRNQGRTKMQTTLRDLRDWTYPNGWERKRHLPAITQGLREMHNYRVTWERREWILVSVLALPTASTQLEDPLPLAVEFPPGTRGVGPLIDMTILSILGIESAPKFRAYLRLAYIWDEAKKKNNGNRIYATRPKVKRNDRNQPVDSRDNIIPGGNWNHPRAVWRGEMEKNPAADRVPPLDETDMIRLFFDDKPVSNAARWKRLERARQAAEEMQDDGYIAIQNEKQGWRLLETYRAP